MQVKLSTGVMNFAIEDVYRFQEYPGTDNRWLERAFLFRDGSILWETMGFSTYAADGSTFSTGGIVHQNGALHLPGRVNGDYPRGINRLVEEIKKLGTKVYVPFSEVWELSAE
jgi:hypothetical protein